MLQQRSHGSIARWHHHGEQGAAVQPAGPALELIAGALERGRAELVAAQGERSLPGRQHQHQSPIALAGALATEQIAELAQAALIGLEQQQLGALGDGFDQLLPVGNAGVEHQQGAVGCLGSG